MSKGLEEVKKQLSSQNEQERLAALSKTLNYGQPGLELLIEESIKDKADRVKQFAYSVFRGENYSLNGNTPESLTPCPTDVITSLAISPDNTILVGGSWQKIWVWDLQTGAIIRSIEGHSRWVLSVAISPDGNTLVSGGADKTIKVWNLKTGSAIRTLNGHSSWITAVAIPADGKKIVSGSTDKTIKIWDLNTGKLSKTIKNEKELSCVLSLCISHDGKVIACGSTNNKITLCNLDSGKILRSIEGHSAWIQSLSITSDNTTLISGSRDGVIKFWQSKTKAESSTELGSVWGQGLVDVAATVAGVLLGWPIAVGAWVLGRIIVAAADNGDVSALPIQNLECTNTYSHDQSINSLADRVNQNILVVGFSKEIKNFDLKDHRIIYTLPEQPGFISSVVVSPNGKTLVIAGKDWVTLLEAKTGKALHAIKGCSYPKLSKIVIIVEPPLELLYGQSKRFTVKGYDQNNIEMNLNNKDVKWESLGGEKEQDLFTAGQMEGSFEVKAKIGIFEAYVPITIISPPTITEICVTPSSITLEFKKRQQFTAQVLDQRRNQMQETVLWEVSGGGKIDQNGNFIAGSKPGKFEIIASVSSLRRVIPITIIAPPRLTKLIIISSIPQLEFGQSFHFQVKGLDQYDNNIQTGKITWSASSGGGTIDQNGNFIAGKEADEFEIIASAGSIVRRIPVRIIEPPRLTELIFISSIYQLEFGQSFQFQVKGLDQYGDNIQTGKVTWSAISGNIDNRGIFYAGEREDTVIIKASVGTINTYTEIKVYEPSRLTFLEIFPSSVILEPGESQRFNVVALNQRREDIFVSDIEWNATDGLIDHNGNFCGGEQQKGACQVTVKVGHLSANAEVTVTPVLRGLKISPEQVEIKPEEKFTFTVTGLDQVGDSLEITNVRWTTTAGGSITDKGTFKGDYKKREVTVIAKLGKLSNTAKVILLPVLRRLEIQPGFVYLKSSEQQTFVVKGFDQFGFSIAPGEVYWETTGGKIAQDGTLTFTQNEYGYFQVTATSQLVPKYTQEIRKLFLYTGISTRIISYLISYQTLLQEMFALDSGSTDSEEHLDDSRLDSVSTDTDEHLDDSKVDETQLDTNTETVQETDTIVEAEEQLNIEVDTTTDIDTIVDTNVLDFNMALEGWFLKKLQKLVARIFFSISRFCLSEASANLSASADVFVLAVEDNPYKYFKFLKMLEDHSEFITSLVITPDGQKLISGSFDETIKIWDLETGYLLNTLKFHTGGVKCVAITPDGQTLVSAGWDNTIKIWDLKTNELLHSLPFSNNVVLVAITPDGQKFISSEEYNITPDGQKFISNEEYNIINLWDLNTQKILRNLVTHSKDFNSFRWHKCIVISPDQQRIIMGRTIIKSYDFITGKSRTIIRKDLEWIYALAITPDGKTLISSHDIKIKIWDLTKKSPDVRLTLNSSAEEVQALILTPDGQRLVSAGWEINHYWFDERESLIEIWDLNTGEKLHSIKEYFTSDSYACSLAITPDGKKIISGYSDGTIRIWGIPELSM